MKKPSAFLVPIAVLAAILAFAFVDFRIAQSRTENAYNASTSRSGGGLPYAMRENRTLAVSILGEERLVKALEKSLVTKLRAGGIDQVEWIDASSNRIDRPFMRIDVGDPRSLWTPFFAKAEMVVAVDFDSHGDVTGNTPIVADNAQGTMLKLNGEYRVQDTTWGLVSYPGYTHMLANNLAGEISKTILDLYCPK